MNTTELAIITTGIVGLGAPVLSAALQTVRDRALTARARSDKDLDELRSLLDETAATMYTHTTEFVALETWMQRSSFGLPTTEEAPSITATRSALSNQRARLVIRRGREDGLVTSLIAYLKRTDDALAEIEASWSKHEPFDYTDEQLAGRADRYWHDYETFVDACEAEVGSRIVS